MLGLARSCSSPRVAYLGLNHPSNELRQHLDQRVVRQGGMVEKQLHRPVAQSGQVAQPARDQQHRLALPRQDRLLEPETERRCFHSCKVGENLCDSRSNRLCLISSPPV